ncbi:MAG: DUF819 family protein [Sphingomonadales bacterium]
MKPLVEGQRKDIRRCLVLSNFLGGISEIIIGSAACVGGVTPATAIASAKGWPSWVTPGIIVGTIGNSFGTFIGVWVWTLFS